jgi:hypothetical protein
VCCVARAEAAACGAGEEAAACGTDEDVAAAFTLWPDSAVRPDIAIVAMLSDFPRRGRAWEGEMTEVVSAESDCPRPRRGRAGEGGKAFFALRGADAAALAVGAGSLVVAGIVMDICPRGSSATA